MFDNPTRMYDLLVSFTNPNNDVRAMAEAEYLTLEQSSRQEVVTCLLDICGSAPSQTVQFQAILRLIAIFRKNDGDHEQQAMIGMRLLQLLTEPSVPDERKQMIVSTVCDCLPAMVAGERAAIPDLDSFFLRLAHVNFSLAVPFFAGWYGIHKNDAIYDSVAEIFRGRERNEPREMEMMMLMSMIRCQVHGRFTMDGMGEVLDGMVQLPDENFHGLLLNLENMFCGHHKDFDVGVLEKMLVMLIMSARNERRNELIRVQCLDAFGEFVLRSHNCKQIILSNHEEVMTAIAMCVSECDRYEDLYMEAKSLLHRVIRTTVGEGERRVYEGDMKRLIAEWKQNPYVCSTLGKFLYDMHIWPMVLELARVDEEHVRSNCISCFISMVSLWLHHGRPQEFSECFKRTVEIVMGGLLSDVREQFYDLYYAIHQHLDLDLNQKVVSMLLSVSNHGASAALRLCAKIKDHLPDEVKQACVTQIVQLAMSRYKEYARDDDLIALGGVFGDLPPELQDKIMSELPFCESEDLLSSHGFALIIEGLGPNLQKYIKRIIVRVLELVSRPVTCETTMSDDKMLVLPSEELRIRGACVELVHCMMDMSREMCLPYMDTILNIVDKILESPCDTETRGSAITLLNVAVEISAEQDPTKTLPLLQKSADLLIHERDFIPMRTLVGVLLFQLSLTEVPDQLLKTIAKAVVAASINLHKIMRKLKDDDDYEDDLSTDYLSQFVEDVGQIFDHVFRRSVAFGFQCCKTVIQHIPDLSDRTASWVVRALSACLWGGIIHHVDGVNIPERITLQMMALLSEDHWVLRQMGIVCLSTVVQKHPFSQFTLRYLEALVEIGKSDEILSWVAVTKLGENLNHFFTHLDIMTWLGCYVSFLQNVHSGSTIPDEVYVHLLHLVIKLSHDPVHAETVAGLTRMLTAAMKGVVGDVFMMALSAEDRDSPVVLDLVNQVGAS